MILPPSLVQFNNIMKNLIVIKIGGSVITDKTKSEPTLRKSVIKDLAKQIAKLYKQNYSIVLVHGAGSFGHPIVKRFNLHLGMKTDEQKQAFAQTLLNMKQLNGIVIESLQKQLVPAVGLHPHNFITQQSGKITKFNTNQIKNLIKQKIVPVLHGDGVIDLDQGCSIISGDTIVPYIAKKLKAQKVYFLTDVDGIYDSDPKQNPNAKLIPHITDKNLKEILKGITQNNPNDVTGEMSGKVLVIKNNLKRIPIFITNGLTKSILVQIVNQGRGGTKLHFN